MLYDICRNIFYVSSCASYLAACVDESQRIDQGKRDLSSLERNASSNNESISASERRLEDAGIQQRRMDRNLNNIRSNNTEAAAIGKSNWWISFVQVLNYVYTCVEPSQNLQAFEIE